VIRINRHSIFFNITVIFLISILFISLTFFVVIKNSKRVHHSYLKRKYARIIRPVLREIKANNGVVTDEVKKRLESLNLEILNIKNRENIKQLSNVCTLSMPRYRIRVFQKGKHYYISVKTHYISLLLKDNNSDVRSNRFLLLMLFAITVILFVSYIYIIRKLYPLKLLQDKIKRLGEGEFDMDCKIKGKDEISILANEFDKSIKNLQKLKDSRNVFLRNIMHELKTPITKGRFLIKLPSNEQNQEKLERVFIRLETLINEFASIEELMSSSTKLEKKSYYVADIVDNAIDLLFDDECDIEVQNLCEDKKVEVNFKLFSIAIKNLIDNAIKYSTDKKAIVKITENEIVVINKGEKLSYPLEKYFEPFFKDDRRSADQSFGLGLYIVHNILQIHNTKLQYSYKENLNIFSISI